MITDQSHQLERAKGTTSRWRKGLKRHRDGRRHARVLYNMLVQGQGWKCSCRNKHTVCFRLDSNTMNIQQGTDQASKNRFLMMLSAAKKSPHPTSQWHEVEFLPEIIEKTVPVHLEQTSQQSLMSASEGRRRVQFATDSTTVCVEAVNPALGHFGSINDLCATLECFNNESLLYSRNPVGYISSQTSDVRFHVRHLKNIGHNLNLRSLQDMLAGSNQLSVPASHSEQLSRRNRLYLAATLACGVLQLHGNWLKQRWGTKDIVFVHDLPSDAIMFDHPYLLWQAATSHLHDNSTEFPSPNAIQNEILLPLAVALTELSLGKTIAALYTTDDQADSELQVHFNTATRTLRRVYCESGSNYGDVVKECLYWSRNKGERFEDPQFDESVFETVVSPLLKDFDYFEGISQAR
ncbi:uncharacterized protein BDV17DRAFT_51763 [Aspergillus undulatus]|uniref:uncharacterized protein n=1 Tax=Aspergillus undulatus TaxID=1810928 RepID=UPI003CCD3240